MSKDTEEIGLTLEGFVKVHDRIFTARHPDHAPPEISVDPIEEIGNTNDVVASVRSVRHSISWQKRALVNLPCAR